MGNVPVTQQGHVPAVFAEQWMVPLFSSSTELWILPLCYRDTSSTTLSWRRGRFSRSILPTSEIPQLQFIDQVLDVLVAQVRQIRAKSWETVEIPQLPLVFSWTSCCTPVVCNNRCPWSMTWRNSSTVVNVPVIMRDSGSAPDS